MSLRNKTLRLNQSDVKKLNKQLMILDKKKSLNDVINKVIHQDMLKASVFLPSNTVDVLFLDPPYNLSKNFNGVTFKKKCMEEYTEILDQWIRAIIHTLKPTASIYICGDWYTSTSIHIVASKYFFVRNRISWEREKGRGALSNWKNCSEDIWFCTMSEDYHFNPEAVKMKRKVIAPYRNGDNTPKDWDEDADGRYRLTYPSNLWTDITVPFWSMPENTVHPTQKPEKLAAKLILASSKEGDIIFDPFLGSGTTAVTAYKLNRNYIGIEQNQEYSCLALLRLHKARLCKNIQGYNNGMFWERNSLSEQKKQQVKTKSNVNQENFNSLIVSA